MAITYTHLTGGLNLVPQNTISPSVPGDIRYNSTTNLFETYNGTLDSLVTLTGSQVLTNKTITGTLTGNSTTATTATNATNVATTTTVSASTFYPVLAPSNSTTNQALDTSSLSYVPSTGNLTATTFTGALSGNATTATNAGSATTAVSATTATNIAGGVAGSILYQSAAGVTTVLGVGTAGQSLVVTGGVPVWNSIGSVMPVTLSYGGTVALNAALGTVFNLTATGNCTILAPTNPIDGEKIVIVFTASGGPWTLTLASGAGGFVFGTDIPALTSTAAGITDYIGCIYQLSTTSWNVVAYSRGF